VRFADYEQQRVGILRCYSIRICDFVLYLRGPEYWYLTFFFVCLFSSPRIWYIMRCGNTVCVHLPLAPLALVKKIAFPMCNTTRITYYYYCIIIRCTRCSVSAPLPFGGLDIFIYIILDIAQNITPRTYPSYYIITFVVYAFIAEEDDFDEPWWWGIGRNRVKWPI